MSGRRRSWLVWVMVLGALLWGLPESSLTLLAAGKEPVTGPRVKCGPIVGQVFKADGKMALPEVVVKVVRIKDGKVIAEVQADKKGHYEIPALKVGEYRIIVADRIFTDIVVAKSGKVTTIDFRIPATYLKAADATGEAAAGAAAGEGASLTPFLLIGTGIASAIALPVTLSDGSSSDEEASATE